MEAISAISTVHAADYGHDEKWATSAKLLLNFLFSSKKILITWMKRACLVLCSVTPVDSTVLDH